MVTEIFIADYTDIFYVNDFVKFIHDQFFERGRNVMIIVYNRNTSTRNPGSDETNIFRRQSPTRIRTVKTYIVQLPSLTTVPSDQRPEIYYSCLKSTCYVNLLSKLSIIFKEWRVTVLFVL